MQRQCRVGIDSMIVCGSCSRELQSRGVTRRVLSRTSGMRHPGVSVEPETVSLIPLMIWIVLEMRAIRPIGGEEAS
jgi:hypothetical protein